MKIKILYEDKDILGIEKPSGILTHTDENNKKEENILDWAKKKYKDIFLVHRLDRETSGILLLAKNNKVYEFLKNQFKNREIKKTYVAIVNGYVKNDFGIINKPIGRSPKDFRRKLAGRGVRGEVREAITEYKVLKRFEAKTSPEHFFYARGSQPVLRKGRSAKKNAQAKFSYLEIKPKTGRTHQIRVHLKFINYPIICDTLYNPEGVCLKNINRLALHAKSIEFKSLKDNLIKIESKIPKEFLKVIK